MTEAPGPITNSSVSPPNALSEKVHAIANHQSDAAFLTVPDAHLLFSAEFKRSGSDLTLIGPNGQHFTIFDYFLHEKRPDLVSPDGGKDAHWLRQSSVFTLVRGLPLKPSEVEEAALKTLSTMS